MELQPCREGFELPLGKDITGHCSPDEGHDSKRVKACGSESQLPDPLDLADEMRHDDGPLHVMKIAEQRGSTLMGSYAPWCITQLRVRTWLLVISGHCRLSPRPARRSMRVTETFSRRPKKRGLL